MATEHGDELKLTGAQRRDAMRIPINLQFGEGGCGVGGGRGGEGRHAHPHQPAVW